MRGTSIYKNRNTELSINQNKDIFCAVHVFIKIEIHQAFNRSKQGYFCAVQVFIKIDIQNFLLCIETFNMYLFQCITKEYIELKVCKGKRTFKNFHLKLKDNKTCPLSYLIAR